MSPMFSEMAGQNVTNGTFPKTLGPKASTYVGYTVIQVLMQLWCGKRKEAFWYPQPFVHTLCAFSQINAPVSNISKLAFLKSILKTERFKTYCQRFGVCFTNYLERRSFPWPLVHYKLKSCVWLQLQKERLACKLCKLVVFCQAKGMLLEARVLPRFDKKKQTKYSLSENLCSLCTLQCCLNVKLLLKVFIAPFLV